MTDTNPIPDGYTSVTPYLVVEGAAKAIEWYGSVFGATLVGRNDAPDGRVAHAELDLGNGRIQLSDPMPDKGLQAPDGTNNVNHSYVLYCKDVDSTFERATVSGAHVYEEPATFFTGDRFCSILDPFGHRWAIMTRRGRGSGRGGTSHQRVACLSGQLTSPTNVTPVDVSRTGVTLVRAGERNRGYSGRRRHFCPPARKVSS